MAMSAPIAIVDCNNFYASCERVFNPKLRGKAIVALSNNDGIIVARSNEAKSLGIPMGSPLFKVQDIIDKHDVQVFSSNYSLYGDMSHRVMTTLEQFSPNVEIYSIDEAFISFDGMERLDLEQYCREMRETVLKWTGITVSIGLAPTKTLAKIANRRAKKVPEFEGVLNLVRREYWDIHLKATEVSDIWGVGAQYTKLLQKHNINTAYDFVQAPEKWVRKKMTVMGLRTQLELKGTPCISLEHAPPAKKSIVSSRSFGRRQISKQDIKEAAALFASRAAEKMRAQKSGAKHLTVFLRTNPFKDVPQYHNGCLVDLPVLTDSTAELIEYSQRAVEQIYREGYQYQKVGVMLSDLAPVDNSQYSLFDGQDRQKMARITELLDRVNIRYGSGTLFYAASGVRRGWGTRCDLRSPRYTTNWNQLPEATAHAEPGESI